VPKKLKEVRVPRKCNTFNIANNKIHHWLQDGKGKELEGAMVPQERGINGLRTKPSHNANGVENCGITNSP
jgi:hypothetical protein